jgi:hypothetical protein
MHTMDVGGSSSGRKKMNPDWKPGSTKRNEEHSRWGKCGIGKG